MFRKKLHQLWATLRWGVTRIISEFLRERIGQSLTFGLLPIKLDTFSSTWWFARDLLILLPLAAVLFDMRLSARAELTGVLTPSMALASFFWRALKVFFSPLSIAFSVRCGNTWNPLSVWLGAVMAIEFALPVHVYFDFVTFRINHLNLNDLFPGPNQIFFYPPL